MKILLVCQYYYPEPFLINEIAPSLVERGHTVTVLTGLPNYPTGVIPSEYKKGKRDEVHKGVNIIRTFEVARGKNYLSLTLNYISFAISGTIKALELQKEYDVILAYQLSPILMVLPALAYKKKNKIPLLLYCLDIWPESAQAHIKNKHGICYSLISKVSKKIYQCCDTIAVTSSPFIDYMTQINGVTADKLHYIPQHGDESLLEYDLSSTQTDTVNFMYAGNLGKGQTLDIILQAANLLKHRSHFFVHFVGDGSCRSELQELASNLGIADKVIFHGCHPSTSMYQFYKMADVLLITLRGNNFVGNTMPGKLQTYLTTGKPILGALNGAGMEVIRESQCGACVSSGDYAGLATLMEHYLDYPSHYELCGKNGKQYFTSHFTKEIYLKKIEAELHKLCHI